MDIYLVLSPFCDCRHKTRLAATSDASNDFDHASIVVESTNLLKIVFSFVKIHGQKYITSASNCRVKGVSFCVFAESCPLNLRIFCAVEEDAAILPVPEKRLFLSLIEDTIS